MQKKNTKPKLLKLEKFNEKEIRKLLNKQSKETLIDLVVNFEFKRIGVLNANRQTMNNNILRNYNILDF
jgi:ribosomal protein L25 (general stress protein Ctc)